MSLIVTEPFDGLAKGDRIVDRHEIEAILAGDHRGHVVRINDGEETDLAQPEAAPRVVEEAPSAPAKAPVKTDIPAAPDAAAAQP